MVIFHLELLQLVGREVIYMDVGGGGWVHHGGGGEEGGGGGGGEGAPWRRKAFFFRAEAHALWTLSAWVISLPD